MILDKRRFADRVTDLLLAFFLIMNMQTVYSYSISHSYHIYELSFIMAAASALYRLIRFGINYKRLFILIAGTVFYYVYIAVFAAFSVKSGDMFNFFSRFAALPLTALYFFCGKETRDYTELFRFFINIMAVICAVSLFFWFMSSFLGIIQPTGIEELDWSGSRSSAKSYYGLYFELQWADIFGLHMMRNCGIFMEGPKFSQAIITALMAAFIFRGKIKVTKLQYAIFIIALITTFSVAGYLYLAILAAAFIFESRRYRRFIIIALPIAAALGLYLWSIKKHTGSGSLRIRDYILGFKILADHPIFGAGFKSTGDVFLNVYHESWNASSNGFSVVMGEGGLWLLSVYMFPIIYGIRLGCKLWDIRPVFAALSYFYLFVTVDFHMEFINFYIWFLLCMKEFYAKLLFDLKNVKYCQEA